MLVELKQAHTTLLRAMAELDTLTRGPLPTKDRIIDARWNISRASLARRTLWGRINNYLSSHGAIEDLADLRRLQEGDMVLLRSSSEHVARWKITAIVEEWPAYCEASKAIRWKMQAAIGAEQRLLYPMLGACTDQRHRQGVSQQYQMRKAGPALMSALGRKLPLGR